MRDYVATTLVVTVNTNTSVNPTVVKGQQKVVSNAVESNPYPLDFPIDVNNWGIIFAQSEFNEMIRGICNNTKMNSDTKYSANHLLKYYSTEKIINSGYSMAYLRKLPAIFKQDKRLLSKLAENFPQLSLLIEYGLSDETIIKDIILQNLTMLQVAPEKIKNDKQFIMQVISKNPYCLRWASNMLQDDPEMIHIAKCKLLELPSISLPDLPENLLFHKEIVLAAVRRNGKDLQYAPYLYKNNQQIVLAAVSNNGLALKYASIKRKRDALVVIEAVKQNGCALKYSLLRDIKPIVLEAVSQDNNALQYASVTLQEDEEVLKKVNIL